MKGGSPFGSYSAALARGSFMKSGKRNPLLHIVRARPRLFIATLVAVAFGLLLPTQVSSHVVPTRSCGQTLCQLLASSSWRESTNTSGLKLNPQIAAAISQYSRCTRNPTIFTGPLSRLYAGLTTRCRSRVAVTAGKRRAE